MTADDDRKRRLEKTVTDLQGRFGLRAIGRLAGAPAPTVIPTGFPALDAALCIGGLPRGRGVRERRRMTIDGPCLRDDGRQHLTLARGNYDLEVRSTIGPVPDRRRPLEPLSI